MAHQSIPIFLYFDGNIVHGPERVDYNGPDPKTIGFLVLQVLMH